MQQPTEQQTKAGLNLDRIRAALTPTLAAHGILLVDVEWVTERVGWTLRLTIEREGTTNLGGGVSLEDCVEASRDASSVLDTEDIITHQYHLEVTSPGLDRKLRTPSDFARFTGKTAKVKLSRPAPDGQRLLRGPLDSAPEGRVAVIVDGKRIEVPFDDVEEARLVFELTPNDKPGKSPQKPKAKRGREPRGTKRT